MSVTIEAIIELKAPKEEAERLAGRVRSEKNLNVSVSDANQKRGGNNGYYGNGKKPANGAVDMRLFVTGQTSSYQKARRVEENLRGMLRHSEHNDNSPILAFFQVYNKNGDVIYNG